VLLNNPLYSSTVFTASNPLGLTSKNLLQLDKTTKNISILMLLNILNFIVTIFLNNYLNEVLTPIVKKGGILLVRVPADKL
jgi:hypothetical protein